MIRKQRLFLCLRRRTFEYMPVIAPQSIGYLHDLALRVADDGVDAERADVARVARRASRLGASSVLTDLVIDPREPQVARQRAFGELASFLSAQRSRPQPSAEPVGPPTIAWPVKAA